MAPTNTYFYSAMKLTGGKARGIRAARDESALSDELRKSGLLLLRAKKVPDVFSGMASGTSRGRLPLADEAALNNQLHVLLSRGVPLVEALEVGADVVSDRSVPRVNELRELVAGGASFAKACRDVGGFDEVAISVYKAAERTGDLAGAAGRLAQAAERRLAIRGKATTVMIYPVIVTMVSIALLFALLVFVVPSMAESVRAAGDASAPQLPWISVVVFGLGEWMANNLLQFIMGAVVVLCILVVLRKSVIAGLVKVSSKIPAVASMLMAAELTRFFSVLAAMTKSGVPLAEALDTSTGSISDNKLRNQLDQTRKSLVEGGTLRTLIEKIDALPLATRKLLIAAERSGDLDQAFDALSVNMAEELDTRSSRLLALMEPAVILAMFSVLGPMVVAIALPMIKLNQGG
ncbi:MAG: type II secretion system F family protein [Phycisphaerales bacterium JB065]